MIGPDIVLGPHVPSAKHVTLVRRQAAIVREEMCTSPTRDLLFGRHMHAGVIGSLC